MESTIWSSCDPLSRRGRCQSIGSSPLFILRNAILTVVKIFSLLKFIFRSPVLFVDWTNRWDGTVAVSLSRLHCRFPFGVGKSNHCCVVNCFLVFTWSNWRPSPSCPNEGTFRCVRWTYGPVRSSFQSDGRDNSVLFNRPFLGTPRRSVTDSTP